MKITEYIDTARSAHVTLRLQTEGNRPDENSSVAYKTFKTAVDQLWTETSGHPNSQPIRTSLSRLTVDAEFFAGLNDSEGFYDAAEVWREYEYLKQTIASHSE